MSSQRDVLIDLLNSGQIDCMVCFERTENDEPIWSCRICFQIFHLKCITIWYLKSYNGTVWKCPACQCEVNDKPNYSCFCGNLTNPFSNNEDTPHTCGQICGIRKRNSNKMYDCHHKCTLLCHPGPCPRCVVQVQRTCGCGKTKVYIQCGQSAPIACNNICSKQLTCKSHFCENVCHDGNCEPCKYNCSQEIKTLQPYSMTNAFLALINQPRATRNEIRNTLPSDVNEEELRMLGIDPVEIMINNNQINDYEDSYETDEYRYSNNDDDYNSLQSSWEYINTNNDDWAVTNESNEDFSTYYQSYDNIIVNDSEDLNSTDSQQEEDNSTRYSSSADSDQDSSVNNSDESGMQDISVARSIEETDSDSNGDMDSDDEDGELEDHGFRYSLNNSCSCSYNSNRSDEDNDVYHLEPESSCNCSSPNSRENTDSICSYVSCRNSDSPPFLSDSEPYQTE